MQRAGDLELIDVDRRDGLRGQQGERVDADDDGGFERLAALLRHLEEHVGMARQQQHAETVRAAQLAAVDRDVLLSRARIAGDHQPGGDIGAAVVLVVDGKRQQAREVHVMIGVTMDHLLRRRRRGLPPRDRIERGVLEARQDLARLDAHRLGHPAAVGYETGDDRNRMPARTRKQRCAQPVETLGDGRELEAKPDAGLDDRQPVTRREMVEPVPQRADRLRRVVAARSRRVVSRLSGGLKRSANVGHTCLDANGIAEMYHCRATRPTRAGEPNGH